MSTRSVGQVSMVVRSFSSDIRVRSLHTFRGNISHSGDSLFRSKLTTFSETFFVQRRWQSTASNSGKSNNSEESKQSRDRKWYWTLLKHSLEVTLGGLIGSGSLLIYLWNNPPNDGWNDFLEPHLPEDKAKRIREIRESKIRKAFKDMKIAEEIQEKTAALTSELADILKATNNLKGLSTLAAVLEDEKKILISKHGKQTKAQTLLHQKEMEDAKNKHEKELADNNSSHAYELKNCKDEHEKSLARLKEKHANELVGLKKVHAAELANLEAQHKNKLDTLNKDIQIAMLAGGKLLLYSKCKDSTSLNTLHTLLTDNSFSMPTQRFSKDFWKDISNALINNFNSATSLSFEGTWIKEDDGFTSIIESLKNNNIVTSLNLKRTSIGYSSREDIKEITLMLSTNKTITDLNLSNTFVSYYDDDPAGSKDIKNIAEMLQKNSTIKSIDLSGTYVKGKDLKILEQALSKNTTLNKINLSNTHLWSSERDAFEKKINANRKPDNLIKVTS